MSRRWRAGAPVVWTDPKLVGMIELEDVAEVVAWLRTIDDTSWEIELPNGIAVIGPNVPEIAAAALAAWPANGAPLDPDRFGSLDGPFPWTSRGVAMLIERMDLVRGIAIDPIDPIDEIARLGRAGLWRWTAPPAMDARAVCDRAALALDLAVLGAGWIAIDRARCRALLASALERDLAYRMKRRDARPEHAAIVDRFDEAAECFTNGTWDDDFSGASTPIGTATFDLAFAIVDSERVAIVWIGDED